MTADEELAQLCRVYPEWRFRHGRGELRGWHATLHHGNGSVIVAADGPAQLRIRLRNELNAMKRAAQSQRRDEHRRARS